MDKNELPVSLTASERIWGLRYLLFALIFLGSILSLLLSGFKAIYIDTAYFVINFIAVCLIFRCFLPASFRLGLTRIGKVLLASALGLVLYFSVSKALNALYAVIMPEFFNVNDASIIQSSQEGRWLTFLGTVVLVPVTEETLHRGLIFGALHSKNRGLAYAISSLLFCYIHVSGYIGAFPAPVLLLCFLQYLPAGLVLAWAYEYSGSILAPVIMHTAVNAIAMLTMR